MENRIASLRTGTLFVLFCIISALPGTQQKLSSCVADLSSGMSELMYANTSFGLFNLYILPVTFISLGYSERFSDLA